MAESVVSFVVEKLYNLLKEEAGFLRGVHDQVDSLQRELRQMRAFLRDAEYYNQLAEGQCETHMNIVNEVREIAYTVEDVVDTYILKMHRRSKRRGSTGLVKKYLCILCRLHNIGMEIEQINKSLQRISDMRSRYVINDLGARADQQTGTALEVDRIVQEKRALPLERETDVFVGFEDNMNKIAQDLLDGDNKPERCVVSIVGMGGAGKTTLAKRICNRADVMDRFQGRCALVAVSQTWSLRKIFEDIAVEYSGQDRKQLREMDEGDLKKVVFKSLQHKRYLIVLDDIWRADVWHLIKPHLPDEKNGSRVMITTRLTDVAGSADKSMKPHHLLPLSEDESWRLFTKLVFSGDNEEDDAKKECTGELREFSERILKSCGGLPLAIILMGSLLATREKRPSAWLDVEQGVRWEEVPGGQVFRKVLALSYVDLPHHLKTCFLYLGLFPEDFEIEAGTLIRLWVAEGLVPNHEDHENDTRGHGKQTSYRTMEDTAEDWLEELVRRCLVQDTRRSPSGSLEVCRMHDVVRELCIEEAGKAGLSFQTWQQNVSARSLATTRRLALQGGMLQERRAPKLRTLLTFSEEDISSLSSPQLLIGWRLLRVLDLQFDSHFKEALPTAIGDLIHLRYLGLRFTLPFRIFPRSKGYFRHLMNLERGGIWDLIGRRELGFRRSRRLGIPSSVGDLQNLQTLEVQGVPLPDVIWQIKTLRHVLLHDEQVEPQLQIGGQHLGNLQTLATVRAGGWIESSLATWTGLRTLSIAGIRIDHHLALSNSLNSLVHLRSLSLSCDALDWQLTHNGREHPLARFPLLPRKALALPSHRRLDELILFGRLMIGQDPRDNYTSDEIPPNLSRIHLFLFVLQQDPLLLLEKLSYLRTLTLCVDFCNCAEVVCSAGGFPQLEELELFCGPWLSRWTVEAGAMPRLRSLAIGSCERLERIPDGLQHLRALQTLNIVDMPVEFVRRLRKEDGVGGEDWHKIQHIPHVTLINGEDSIYLSTRTNISVRKSSLSLSLSLNIYIYR
ncbi:hypothetical protein Taro_036464 [Colocasia esculenta]|uniref:Uncharacterized protein n=1 Tax=Colocasia esculenta TaxID=4460 RepID=A0A843WDG2_COLES|nr:hypothetical protein [Colocasia esculenta]